MNVAPTLVKMKEHVNSGKIHTNASAEMVMRARTVKGTLMTVHKIHVKRMESVLTWKMISSASANQVQNQRTLNIKIKIHFFAGFTGKRCEENINECNPNPCVDGDCQDLINGYLCDCKDGFTGTNCEININECDPDPCLNGATCLDLDSRYECQCPIGFQGFFSS